MSEIGKVPAHKTTHQDGGSDELVLTGILPGVHKTTHQDAVADEIDATGLTGRCDFVDRGDPSAPDFVVGDLTASDSWVDLSLSTIVPAGTIAVALFVEATHAQTARNIYFRKKGNTAFYNISSLVTSVVGIYIFADVIVFLDANRTLQYYLNTPAWAAINITVKGWWI